MSPMLPRFRCSNHNLVKNIYTQSHIHVHLQATAQKSVTRLKPAPFKQFSLLPFRTVDTLVKLSFRSVTGPVCTCHLKHAPGIWISVGY